RAGHRGDRGAEPGCAQVRGGTARRRGGHLGGRRGQGWRLEGGEGRRGERGDGAGGEAQLDDVVLDEEAERVRNGPEGRLQIRGDGVQEVPQGLLLGALVAEPQGEAG